MKLAITFRQASSEKYSKRTWENAKAADLTLAIASDFNTWGEKLTQSACKASHKHYITLLYRSLRWKEAVDNDIAPMIKDIKPKIINIAGNGIYTLAKDPSVTQDVVDLFVFDVLSRTFNKAGFKPMIIRSGGQTGIDEAGIKAAVKLGIKAYCLAPRGWMYRDIEGNDITNEFSFKHRFKYYMP